MNIYEEPGDVIERRRQNSSALFLLNRGIEQLRKALIPNEVLIDLRKDGRSVSFKIQRK